MRRTMTKAVCLLFLAGFIASTVSAQTVIAPLGCVLENARPDSQSDGPWLDKSTALWWNSSGIISDAALIADGEPVPAVWPQHSYGWNAGAWAARVRDTGETPESPIGTAILTFDIGTIADVEGVVLWNHGEGAATESDRGVQTAAISWSANGVDFVDTGETLTFAKGPQASAPIDAQVQMLASTISGATHLRMSCTSFSSTEAIVGFGEIRLIGTRAPVLTYVSTTPVDWNDANAWSDGNPVTTSREYLVDNGVALETPAVNETFAGTSLTLAGSERLEIMTSGTNDTITIGDLVLDASELAAGVVDAGEARIDGNITVVSNVMFSGATDDSRDLRILGRVVGNAAASVELSAPGHTIYLQNGANDLAGTWIVSGGTAEFASANAVDTASIEVQDGTLRVLDDWDTFANDATLTVADSATVTVDVGTYSWIVKSLTVGSSNVTEGLVYSVAELDAIGAAVFTGTGTIQVGELPPPPFGDLIAGWDTWESATAPVESYTAPGVSVSATTSGGSGNWVNNDGSGRGSSKDGTWGYHPGPPTASEVTDVGPANLSLTNAKEDGEITLTISNNGTEDLVLGAFHFDAVAFRPKAARTYALNVLAGSSITEGNVFTSEDQAITSLNGGLKTDDADPLTHDQHDDIDLDLTGLEDHTIEPGGTAIIQLAFTGGAGDGAGGHHLFLDNVGLSEALDSGPPDAPTMDWVVSGGDMIISWTSDAAFKLQTTPDLKFGGWSDYPGGNASPVTVPATNDVECLRLIQQ